MNQIDRRNWLRTVGLSSTLAFVGGYDVLGKSIDLGSDHRFPARPFKTPVRLSSNENPFGPSEKVRQTIIDSFDLGCRYPFAFDDDLFEMIAQKEGVTKDYVVITGGSTEGLRITGLSYGRNGKEVVSADPTFKALWTYAEIFGAKVRLVPLDETLTHNLEAMEQRVNKNTGLVFICNPNNPSGTIVPPAKYKDFCQSVSKRTLVFSDEAYNDFVEDPDYESMIGLVKNGENVIVSKTFSKVYGLAGLRIGYLIAKPEIAKKLNENLAAYTNILAINAAKTAMEEKIFYDFSLRKNREAKEVIYPTLDELGLRYIKSHTNFVFFETGREIEGVIKQMKEEGVEVGRPFPPLTKWCRISTGTLKEVEVFSQGLKKVMA